MKREYVRPTMVGETFAANEYFAACGKTPDGVYHFKCDAPGGSLYYYHTTTNRYYDWSTRKWVTETVEVSDLLGNYHPCGATHNTTNAGNFYEGFVDYNQNGSEDAGEHVLVWRGDYGNNGHATVSLSMGEIDVERS